MIDIIRLAASRRRAFSVRTEVMGVGLAAVVMTGAACSPGAAPAHGRSGGADASAPKPAAMPVAGDRHVSNPVDRLAVAMARDRLAWTDAENVLGPLQDRRGRLPAGIERAASAKATLPGYGAARLPSGAGTDYRDVPGNEGDASIELYGDAGGVRWWSVSKYYEEPDAGRFVAKVLPSFRATSTTSPCAPPASDEDVDPRVFTLQPTADGRPLTVAVTVDDGAKYGPASTMLAVYDHPPSAAELRCMPLDTAGGH